MHLFGESQQEREYISIIEKLLRNESRLIDLVARLILNDNQPHKVSLVLTQSIKKSKFITMAISIAANQKVLGTLGLVDQVTQQAVTGSFTGATATSDTPAAFTASADDSGNVTLTAVAAGSGTLSVSALAAFTDSTNVAQSQQLTATVPVTVTAVVAADAVNLVVNFGAPVAQ